MTFPLKNYAQSKARKPEKIWSIRHIFVAKKVWEISMETRQITNSHIDSKELDGDPDGGMVDAFRHTLWLALLVQYIKPQAARELGIAHEKSNKIDFKKGETEEIFLPDSVGCEMDLRNNEVGIDIGLEYMGENRETLISATINAVKSGRCWVIKKDKSGNFLDENGKIIPQKHWQGKWNTPKVLVPSNTIRPEFGKD